MIATLEAEQERVLDKETACCEGHDCEPCEDASAREAVPAAACDAATPSGAYGEHSPNMHNKTLGERGEIAACQYLGRRGIEVIDTNWTCRFGEADIVAIDEDCIVFVEVKTRSGVDRGLPEDAITREKRQKYEKIAMAYLEQSSYNNLSVRFDAISITLMAENRAFLRHHKNAFGVGD